MASTRQSVEWRQDLRQVGHEAEVEIHSSQKTLQLHFGLRKTHGRDRFNLGRKRNNASSTNGVSEKRDGTSTKSALRRVDLETCAREALQNGSEIGNMLLFVCLLFHYAIQRLKTD